MPLAGCPLEERISEFNKLRADGFPLGALAMICIDNPMVAATGHRICNDCMKSCIYQKQDPVDIPQSETRVLKDVLALPFGFEIYSLLTRWNPLNLRRPRPLPSTGKRVLVVGQGPAGFTLAHHLLNDGHTVVAIDGLKIEPLDPALSGVTVQGERVPFAPVRDIGALIEPLDARVMAGFGGVAGFAETGAGLGSAGLGATGAVCGVAEDAATRVASSRSPAPSIPAATVFFFSSFLAAAFSFVVLPLGDLPLCAVAPSDLLRGDLRWLLMGLPLVAASGVTPIP